jgi:hypothetical protein
VYFFAIEFPTAGVASGIARQLSQFSHKRITIRFAGELLQVFAHKLIHTLAHGFSAAPSLLDNFVINRQGQVHLEIIRAHVLRVNMLSKSRGWLTAFPQPQQLTSLGLRVGEPKIQTPFLGVSDSVIRNLLRFSD